MSKKEVYLMKPTEIVKKYEYVFLILFLLFLGFIIYSPHIEYPLPLHMDEWHHLSQAKSLIQGDYEFNQSSYKILFHILLIPFVLLPFYTWQFIPAIIAILIGITGYSICKKKWGILEGLLFILILSSIKSNVHVLGLWFTTPLTLGIVLYLLLFYFYTTAITTDSVKHFYIALSITILTTLTYVLAFFALIPYIFALVILKRKSISHLKKHLLAFSLPALAGILIYSITNPSIQTLFTRLLFDETFAVIPYTNSLFSVFSVIGFIFALIGMIVIKEKHLLLLPILQAIHLLVFVFLKVSPLIPYQRLLYFFAITLCLFAAIGVGYIIKKYRFGFIILLLFPLLFIGYADPDPRFSLYQAVDLNILPVFSVLSTQEQGVVILNHFPANGLYLLANQKPFATTYFDNRQKLPLIQEFLQGSCETQKNILAKYSIQYAILEKPSECEHFTLIYEKNYYYLYKIVPSRNTSS